MISGKTTLIAHIGYPTEAFKAALIYNPWFEMHGIDAVVVPMGVKAEDYPVVMKSLFKMTNVRGALVTMPHKVTTVELLDEVTTTVKVAGSCKAILKRADGTLLGDMFDGTGFTRGLKHKGFVCEGARVLSAQTHGAGNYGRLTHTMPLDALDACGSVAYRSSVRRATGRQLSVVHASQDAVHANSFRPVPGGRDELPEGRQRAFHSGSAGPPVPIFLPDQRGRGRPPRLALALAKDRLRWLNRSR